MSRRRDNKCINCGFSSYNHREEYCPVLENGIINRFSNNLTYTPGYMIDDTYESIFDELDKITFYLIRKRESQQKNYSYEEINN